MHGRTKITRNTHFHPDPVPDIAFRHAFGIKVVTISESGDKDGDYIVRLMCPRLSANYYVSHQVSEVSHKLGNCYPVGYKARTFE